jgi:hypothetical protein
MEILTEQEIKKLSIEETKEIHKQFIEKNYGSERTFEKDRFLRDLKAHFYELGGGIKKKSL